jgi:hypothetical protein
MQRALAQLLGCAETSSWRQLRYPKHDDVAASDLRVEIERVYRELGGIAQRFPLNLCRWDIEFQGIAVELDECLHFNRYRGETLKSASYPRLPKFPLEKYRCFCSKHEDKCVRSGSYGKKWSSRTAADQFGCPSPLRDLSGNGSPRWKQRAFYDFVKDLSPLLIGVKVVRISVWDQLVEGETTTVGEVLDALVKPPSLTRSCGVTSAALVALVKERAAD